MENNTIARGIGLLLAAALLFGCFFAVNLTERTEPADPRTEEPERLQPEALSSGRTGGFTAASDSAAEEAPENEPTPTPGNTPEPEQPPEPGSTAEPGGTPEATPDGTGGGGGGDTPGGDTPGGNTGDDGGDDEPEGPSIVTNLYDGMVIHPEDLKNGEFPFYAKAAGDTGLSIEVRFRHGKEASQLLYVNGRQDYSAPVRFGTNYITIQLRKAGSTFTPVTYSIRYEQTPADKDNPTVGDAPPDIEVFPQPWIEEYKEENVKITVRVTDSVDGHYIARDNITFSITDNRTGATLSTSYTGGLEGHSYSFYLPPPQIGDESVYTVRIVAWNEDRSSSSYWENTLVYHPVGEGEVNGSATIVVDATTVGMGVLAYIPNVELRQGVPASQIVLDALEDAGFSVDYAGTVKVGFYIRSLISGGINTGTVPDRLWTMIERDNIGFMDPGTSDSLGEFDYTRGSGWMFSVNGALYADEGLSRTYLQDGQTLYLRYTLSYGKDIGGYGSTGGGYGQFSEYCYRYLGGSEIFAAHGEMKEIERQEPTETEDGYILRECVRCGEQERETLPATAPTPTPEPSPSEEPTPTPEPSPAEPPSTEAPPTEQPTPTPPPVNTPEPAAEPPKPEEPEGGNEE